MAIFDPSPVAVRGGAEVSGGGCRWTARANMKDTLERVITGIGEAIAVRIEGSDRTVGCQLEDPEVSAHSRFMRSSGSIYTLISS